MEIEKFQKLKLDCKFRMGWQFVRHVFEEEKSLTYGEDCQE